MRQKIYLFLILLTLSGLSQLTHAASNPINPFHIAGNLYYVGNSYTASYLIVTPQGNILINSDYEKDVPEIKANIEKLGFKFADTKILLISHAHSDHAGGSALIKQLTGARYKVMDRDVSVIESGGKTDFLFGNDPTQWYPPTKVDRILHDGDQVKLGDTLLVAHLTPGHTKGCTTWTMKVHEQLKDYNVVIVGSPYVNAGCKLVNNPEYPSIASDYKYMWQVLRSLPCDIFLGAHGIYFGLEEKYARMQQGAPNPFIDPQGYQKFLTTTEQLFDVELAKQERELVSKTTH